MSQKPVPIILVGKGDDVANGVIQTLKPDYEVVAFVTSREACIAEIPSILGGRAPPSPSSTLGTGNLSDRPVAVVTGGYFTEGFDDLRDAVEDACGDLGSGLIWLKNDTSKPAPDVSSAEYPRAVAERMKGALGELTKGGKAQHVDESVHSY